MERDPVCGMTVDPARPAATAEHAGKTYYFCCAGCAAKFRAEPKKYLDGKPMAARPVHGEMVQLSGISPARAPLVQFGGGKPPAPPSAKAVVYICPMDPEVRRDHPGPCPKCGMAL